MAWSHAKEEELRQAKQSAGWRWIAYVLTAVGLAIGFLGPGVMAGLVDAATPQDQRDFIKVAWIIAGLILLLAIFVDLPAEKAAKRAKILQAEKSDYVPTAPR